MGGGEIYKMRMRRKVMPDGHLDEQVTDSHERATTLMNYPILFSEVGRSMIVTPRPPVVTAGQNIPILLTIETWGDPDIHGRCYLPGA